MWKKLEIFGIMFLVVIGILWGGGEIYLRKFADGKKLIEKALDFSMKNEDFKASLIIKLAVHAKIKDAKIALALIYIKDKQPQKALYYLNNASKPPPCPLERFYLVCYQQLGDYEKALENFTKMSFLSKNDFAEWVIYNPIGQNINLKEAIFDLKTLIENGNEKYCPYLAMLYLATEKYDLATEYFIKGAKNNDLWSVKQAADMLKNEYPEKALEYYQQAIKLGNKRAVFSIILMYQGEKQYNKALKWCEKANKMGLNTEKFVKNIKREQIQEKE